MFEELNIRTLKDSEGYFYVNLMDLTVHMLRTKQILWQDADRETWESENVSKALYYQGQIDAIAEIGKFFAEGGMSLIASEEIDNFTFSN